MHVIVLLRRRKEERWKVLRMEIRGTNAYIKVRGKHRSPSTMAEDGTMITDCELKILSVLSQTLMTKRKKSLFINFSVRAGVQTPVQKLHFLVKMLHIYT